MADTWAVSIDYANQRSPRGLARPMLELAALLDPNGIPADLLTTEPIVTYCTSRAGRPVDADDLRDTLHLLHRPSLLTHSPANQTIRVHALVQRAVRDATLPDQHQPLAEAAADALIAQWLTGPARDPARYGTGWTAVPIGRLGRAAWHV